jgi:hypothetical protein
MSDISNVTWHPVKIVPYGAVLHLPAGWEALPPVPANGPEILRATGGPGQNLIVFKVASRNATAARVAGRGSGETRGPRLRQLHTH